MNRAMRLVAALVAATALAAASRPARAETLADAWGIALGVNQGLQAQQSESFAAGFNLAAARSARYPTVRNFTFNAFLTASPSIKNNLGTAPAGGGSSGGSAGGSGAAAALPSYFPILGSGQRDLPLSVTFAAVPLYTGGKISRSIEAAGAQVGVRRNDEVRTALDLKLTVAEAYVGVLRARKNLEVARSNVEQLTSFARDVKNRRQQGLAIRSDELAAQVSLANAQFNEIQARTSLETAWSTYNRYLCRPMGVVVLLEELTVLPTTADWKDLAERAVSVGTGPATVNEYEVQGLTERAIQSRPELAGLGEQARAGAQAEVARAGIRPQVGFAMAYAYVGANIWAPQGIGAATLFADWTITDGGASRRRSAAFRQQEIAALKRKCDLAADIALQVRTRWLDLQQARLRVPVAHLAVAQAVENVNVVSDRYREQLSTYTEVLDAESRRVQSLTNFYNSLYDESLALFRLRRAVGDL